MVRLIARIKARGVRQPALVRPDPEGGYEIIDGHRRYRASELAERPDMPVIIRDLSDEEAVAEMVDGNVQRENVLPSERAWAYRMYLEADKKRAGRPAKNSPKISANFRSDDEIGKSLGISGDTLRNYIQLTELRQELMDKVDAQEIGLSIAYQIAALTKDEQMLLLDAMEYSQNTPSLSQAQRLKKASKEGTRALETMRDVLSGEKGRDGKADILHGRDPQILSPFLHPQTDAGDHHQAAGGMAEKAPAKPRIVIIYGRTAGRICGPVFLRPKSGGHYVYQHISI